MFYFWGKWTFISDVPETKSQSATMGFTGGFTTCQLYAFVVIDNKLVGVSTENGYYVMCLVKLQRCLDLFNRRDLKRFYAYPSVRGFARKHECIPSLFQVDSNRFGIFPHAPGAWQVEID